MLKRILIGFSVLFIVIISAVLILPGLVPTDTYRDRLEADLSRTFARDVTIDGDIKISTFPILKVETGAVSLANPENYPEGRFVDIDGMTAKVRLLPLLKKRVEISGVTLNSPNIFLDVQPDGRANWVGKEVEDPADNGPFQRDGRFTEYDPALTLLKIEDGTVTYRDLAANREFLAENINLNLQAPALDKPLNLNGNFLFDGMDTTIDAAIASPADFLNGQETDFSADINTPEGQAEVSGKFLNSQDIEFKAKYSVKSEQPNALAKRLPLPEETALPSLSSVSAEGDITFQQKNLKLNGLDLDIKGKDIAASFAGDIDLTEGAASAGSFSAKLDNMAIIRPYLEEPIAALNAVKSVDADGRIQWTGNKFDFSNVKSVVSGPNLTANYTGRAIYDEALRLDGEFKSQISDIPALVKTAGLTQPDAAALKKLSMNGKVNFSNGRATLSNFSAEASDGLLNGQFSGDVIYNDDIEIDGEFSGEISDLLAMDAALPREIPYSDVAKRITIESQIKSTSAGYTLSNLTAELKDGLLNGRFTGALALGQGGSISGDLKLSSESLRAIATSQDIILPESTPTGAIFEGFALAGGVSGTPERIRFESGTIKLDNLSGEGDFTLDMDSPTPFMTGTLDLAALDFRPYMAAWSAQNPTGEIQPWSKAPITLSGLESLDANIKIQTPSIKMDRLELGATNGDVTLQQGVLRADLKNTKLYGGDAAAIFTLNSSGGVPTIVVDATIKSVAAQKFFMASAGFEKLTGTSDLTLSFKGQGKSQADIMKSLSGDGIFKILKGQLLGLDASSLLTGVDQALTTRQLPQGIGIGQSTDFNDIEGKFSLDNGRASLSGFALQAGSFFMDAEGAIDIGQQTIDFGIRPKLADGSDLAKFGIPLRFSGGFGQAKPKLDTDFLGEIVKAKARAKAGNTVRETLGGSLGTVLGGVIGGPTSNSDPSQNPVPETSPPSENTPAEDSLQSTQDPEPAEDMSETNSPEEQIGNALKDLFGRKKKTDGE